MLCHTHFALPQDGDKSEQGLLSRLWYRELKIAVTYPLHLSKIVQN